MCQSTMDHLKLGGRVASWGCLSPGSISYSLSSLAIIGIVNIANVAGIAPTIGIKSTLGPTHGGDTSVAGITEGFAGIVIRYTTLDPAQSLVVQIRDCPLVNNQLTFDVSLFHCSSSFERNN